MNIYNLVKAIREHTHMIIPQTHFSFLTMKTMLNIGIGALLRDPQNFSPTACST
jgi:hypothetical protein